MLHFCFIDSHFLGFIAEKSTAHGRQTVIMVWGDGGCFRRRAADFGVVMASFDHLPWHAGIRAELKNSSSLSSWCNHFLIRWQSHSQVHDSGPGWLIAVSDMLTWSCYRLIEPRRHRRADKQTTWADSIRNRAEKTQHGSDKLNW